jgi:hypothetical protein
VLQSAKRNCRATISLREGSEPMKIKTDLFETLPSHSEMIFRGLDRTHAKYRALTLSTLKHLLHYNPETGEWRWTENHKFISKCHLGRPAGVINNRLRRQIKINSYLQLLPPGENQDKKFNKTFYRRQLSMKDLFS